MNTYVPVGLTYLLEADSGNVTLQSSDIVSSSGKSGPLLLKLTNSSDANIAVVSYDNGFVPGPPPGPQRILVTANGTFEMAGQTVSFYCQFNSATGAITSPINQEDIVASTSGWNGGTIFCKVLGNEIGGASPANDITYRIFDTTGYNPNTGIQSGQVTQLGYQSGTAPTGAPNAILPTAGNPTKVFTIPPLGSDLVQIPSSDNGSTVLVATGADVYVTPIQIVA